MQVQEQYRPGAIQSTRDLGGAYNLNVLIRASRGSFVVRVYRPWVTPERLLGIQKIKRRLHAAGIPVVLPLTVINGNTFIEIDQRLAEVEGYIPNQERPPAVKHYEVSASILGRLHAALGGFAQIPEIPPPEVENYSLPVDLEAGLARVRSRIEMAQAEGRSQALNICALVESSLPYITEEWQRLGQYLPRQLVHGDFGPGNILFDQDQPAAIGDFDFINVHERIFDLAYMLFWMLERLEPDLPYNRRSWKGPGTIIQNYQAAMGQPLTAGERKFLPVEMARVPLHWIAEAAYLPDPVGAVLSSQERVEFARWILEQKEKAFRFMEFG
ncbi:MAG: phosphotransferase enzyme family protein [Omnitrophica WOR_2 bacterium]